MAIATIEATFLDIDGTTPLGGRTLCYSLEPTGAEANIFYVGEERMVKTDSAGFVTFDLWVNDNGLAETEYNFILPDGFSFKAVIPASAGGTTINLFQLYRDSIC